MGKLHSDHLHSELWVRKSFTCLIRKEGEKKVEKKVSAIFTE